MPDHNKDFQQFRALMGLAGERCIKDIFAVVYMYAGMWIFIGAFFTFTLLNLAVNFNHLQVVPYVGTPDISGTTLSNTIISAMIGFVNAVYMLTFLAIAVCLFEYALSFTIVCYYYDNRSWLIPNFVNDTIDEFSNHLKLQREENNKMERKHRVYLENEILKIRNGSVEEPKKE